MSSRKLRFEVYGRQILVERTQDRWSAYYVGADGKRRQAQDIVISASVSESDLEQYLADLFHEWVTEKHPTGNRYWTQAA